MTINNQPIVILLNGPSSSGKSTLAESLQSKLKTPFLHIGIDKMIAMMPEAIHNWIGGRAELGFWWKEGTDQEGQKIYEIQAGPYAQQISKAYKAVVKTLADNGLNVIVDEVAFGNNEMNLWRDQLKNHTTFFLGVISELHTLEEREKARGDRILGSARHQFYTVHQDIKYDLTVKTDKENIEESTTKILKLINELDH